MAQSRLSSATADVVDVTMVIVAFEAMNNIALAVQLRAVADGPAADLEITLEAWTRPEDGKEVQLLGCTSVKCSALGLRTLDSAVLAALYRMDFKLAEQEFEKAGFKERELPG